MTTRARAGDAVRQIEYWYKHFIDSLVQDRRTQTDPSVPRSASITGAVLAYSHEQAWRHAAVRAQKSTIPAAWAALTVEHERAAYESLLAWTAAKYRVAEDAIRAEQQSRGFRQQPRQSDGASTPPMEGSQSAPAGQW